MTSIPKHLTEFPSINSTFPLHIDRKILTAGFEAHRHDFFEFSLVVAGSGYELINDTVHPMKPGTFTFVMPYQIHEIVTDPGQTLQLINCNFGMELFTSTSRYQGINHLLFEADEKLPAFIQFQGEIYEKIKGIVEDIVSEYEQDRLWKQELIIAKLVEVIITFDRFRRPAVSIPARDVSNKKKEKAVIWDIIQYIHVHYRERLSLPLIAQHFHLSVSSLSDLFKSKLGQTFVDFLHDLRIRHACSLLVTTELNISEIALESGFGSYKTFSRVFRERKGVSPIEYRKGYHV
ncbi:AraC family transcriptional regulator [Bacillus alkalicellulosilyticus]|uniref:AraC family transcriptional regulator n=1 Tax=Alkalihalobacterium alkalicellulosilyticum TaxID=1912214 RepID=UPI0009965A8A|nr:AraC family transcriptional regulator [Bacillus alkalicellulosilyticus]